MKRCFLRLRPPDSYASASCYENVYLAAHTGGRDRAFSTELPAQTAAHQHFGDLDSPESTAAFGLRTEQTELAWINVEKAGAQRMWTPA